VKNIIAKIVPISLVFALMLTLIFGCSTTKKVIVEEPAVEPVAVEEEVPVGELQELVKGVGEQAGKLKRLVRKLSKPAHSIPGKISSTVLKVI
jgi:hypothetical protein